MKARLARKSSNRLRLEIAPMRSRKSIICDRSTPELIIHSFAGEDFPTPTPPLLDHHTKNRANWIHLHRGHPDF